MSLTDAARETLRQDLILDQADKSEAGLAMIIDGSHAAEVNLLNALSIVTNDAQAFILLRAIMRMRAVRLLVWGTLGALDSDRMRG